MTDYLLQEKRNCALKSVSSGFNGNNRFITEIAGSRAMFNALRKRLLHRWPMGVKGAGAEIISASGFRVGDPHMLWLCGNSASTLKKSTIAGPVGAVGIAQRFPRACGIPQEFQAIVDPVLWDPHVRQARQLPRGHAPDEDAIAA
jgi:hypothetical protein